MNRSRRTVTKCKNKFIAAKKLLDPSNITDNLPGREKEYADIFNFVQSSILEQVGGCMFIAGVPGTGKTATVLSVMRNIFNDELLLPFNKNIKTIEINGIKLSSPDQFYSHFYDKIFGQKLTKQAAVQGLEDYFSNPNPKAPYLVVLVDELDQLCTKRQNILYHLFDWPNRLGSRVLILSIANTMDLPERIMMTKIQSRLGLRRIPFQAYRHNQLIEIINSRIGYLNLFKTDKCVNLICRKVAAISGDARRALDICKRTLDIAEMEEGSAEDVLVDMCHVDMAVREVFTSDKVFAIASTSEQEKIFIKSLIQEFRIKNSDIAFFGDVYTHHTEKCRFDKIYVPTVRELIKIANDLYLKRVILIEQNKLATKSKISLNVSMEEIDSFLDT